MDSCAFSIFWGVSDEAKVVDLTSMISAISSRRGFRISAFHSKCERHRLGIVCGDGTGNSEESMTAAYSHGGYGWNQRLRAAVSLLHNALLSYGSPVQNQENS